MIALDTNVLIRLVTRDDPAQAAAVERYLSRTEGPFHMSVPVLLEVVWLLKSRFRFARAEIAEVLRALSERSDFLLESAAQVQAAISAYERGADFADELIVACAREAGCSSLATFDADLLKRHTAFALKPA